MKMKIATVAASAVLAAGFATSGFAAGHYAHQAKHLVSGCNQTSHYCGYQVGVVPAGKCDNVPRQPVSNFCGYIVGTYPAGKCANVPGYNK